VNLYSLTEQPTSHHLSVNSVKVNVCNVAKCHQRAPLIVTMDGYSTQVHTRTVIH